MPRLWPGMWNGTSCLAFPLPATAASNGVSVLCTALQWITAVPAVLAVRLRTTEPGSDSCFLSQTFVRNSGCE